LADVNSSTNQRRQSVLRAPGEGQAIPLGDAGVVTLKAVGAETNGTMAVYEFATPPATAGPPLHLHRNWDEAFYVLEGEMTFLIDGETSTAPAGSFIYIPQGILHTFWNASAAPAKQLTIFTPAGIEHYFAAVTRVMAAGAEETLAAAIALMEQHDMIVPPGSRQAYGALSPSDPSN
jgi:quercetin dioxygenase-like cupin family protein